MSVRLGNSGLKVSQIILGEFAFDDSPHAERNESFVCRVLVIWRPQLETLDIGREGDF